MTFPGIGHVSLRGSTAERLRSEQLDSRRKLTSGRGTNMATSETMTMGEKCVESQRNKQQLTIPRISDNGDTKGLHALTCWCITLLGL